MDELAVGPREIRLAKESTQSKSFVKREEKKGRGERKKDGEKERET